MRMVIINHDPNYEQV